MKYSKENPFKLFNPDDIHKLGMRDYFIFKCIKCGNYQTKQVNSLCKIPTHKKMMCTNCLTHVNHATIDKPIMIECSGDYEIKELHKYDYVQYVCKQCGKLHKFKYKSSSLSNNNRELICTNCFRRNFRMDNPEIVVKSMKTIRNNHGGLHNMQTPEGLAKQRESEMKRFGMIYTSTNEYSKRYSEYRSLHPEKYGSKRINWFGLFFDSVPELAVYIYFSMFGFNVIRSPKVSFEYVDLYGNTKHTNPDFMINGQYVEIKGGHFYNPDGTWKFPYKKKKVNGKWVPMTPEEIEYMNDLYRKKQMCLIANGVIIFRDDTPYVQCILEFVKQVFFFNNPKCYTNYIKTNIDNACLGYTPFNCNVGLEYQPPVDIGRTPFDIRNKDFDY